MKDYVLELVRSQTDLNNKRNLMREYLQAYVLKTLHGQGFFRSAAFIGGTALRFLHRLPRFSEDLDFSRTHEPSETFVTTLKTLKEGLHLSGYDVSMIYKDTKMVQFAFIKFKKLLLEAGLSAHSNQLFSIKIELDIRPPDKAEVETVVIEKYFPLAFQTYNIPSLLAGKLHAILCRRYTKGRDYFDLGWYLSKWPDISPNIPFLRKALEQTGWEGLMPTEQNWRGLIYTHVDKTDWRKVHNDVKNFLERPDDLKVFTKENVLRLVGNQ